MKYDTAGVYEVPLSATDECANETVEEREVLVARNVIAGDNITLEQDGNNVTINADVCGALDDCQTITDMQTEIDSKQDALTAGQNITIENNVISSSGEEYTAGQNIQIENGVISATDTTYTAGDNITIEGNVISADDVDLSNYYTKSEADALLDEKVDAETGKGLSTNDFTNADKQKLDGLKNYTAGQNVTIDANGVISADEPDLSNYYTKSETYNKNEVNDLISAIEDFHVQIVQSLPQTGEERTIYFVPKQGGGYTEHMYINNAWEEIGDTDIDLSGYYTKTETDVLLADKADASSVYTKTETDNLLGAKQNALTAGENVQITNDVISATDTTYSEATDTDLGLIKLNSENGINLNADGQLTISGQWGEKDGSVYFGKGSEPSVTGDAGNGVLVTEANGLQIGNKMLSVITGANVNLKVRAAAGATEYQFADNYTNRITLSGFKNGYAALNEAAAKIKTVKVLSVLRDGQELVPSSEPADSTKNIIVTVEESANPDSEARQIRFYGTSGGFSNLVIGQGASNGISNSNSAVVGQNVRNYANLSIVAGGNNYNAGSRSAIFGTNNINPVSGNQNVFLAGQGHDTSNGSINVAAVGEYSDIDANTAFAVGNGTNVYPGYRSNAFEVLKDGRVKASGTPTENDDLATKQYVDTQAGGIAITTYGNADFSYERVLDPDTQEVINECIAYSTVTGSAEEPKAVKYGRVVNLCGAFKNINVRPDTGVFTMGKVPAGCEPLYRQCILVQGTSQAKFLLTIETDGTLKCARYSTGAAAIAVPNNAWLNINATYISAT